MTNNYEYKVGGSLGENAPSYVERQADSDLYHSLKAGDLCYIFNSRQMGKTSLIVRTMKKLEAEGFACTRLDFSVRGNSEQWYAGIVYKLVVNFNIGNPSEFLLKWWQERGAIPSVQRLEDFIETVLLASIQSKIIIFIDEIDSILSLDFARDDFFALIRSCYEKRNFNPEYRRLTFALVGVATPSDLIADRGRTPFNIGKAIQLDGFKDSEIEPLAKGFSGYVENPLALMQYVLTWTGGQPFLTQKVCSLLIQNLTLNHSPIAERGEGGDKILSWVESVIISSIIENWETNDEPVHLKTIRDRMLLGEQIAGCFLGWYQQILLTGNIFADNSVEQMRFRLTGLVVKQQEKLKVYNKIYESVFNSNWVEKELNKLRPYAVTFQAWVDSQYRDESRLLRGRALQEALVWADGKSLSNEDSRYLSASQELEKRELEVALAVKEEESQILAAANEKLSQANKTLSQAQNKSRRMIRFGSTFLVVSIIGAIIASVFANNAKNELQVTQLEQIGINLLQEQFTGRETESLMKAMRAGRELKTLVKGKQSLADYPTFSPVLGLQYILSNIRKYKQLNGHQNEVYGVAFSPDGKTLASASKDKTIKLWNVTTGQQISSLTGHKNEVNSVAFSPDGKTLASASSDKTIKLWNVNTGQQISSLTGHKNYVTSVAFSPDGKTLASASADKTIKLWNVNTGQQTYSLTGHQDYVFSVAFSPDGKTLASASADKTIKLWNVNTGQQISSLTGHLISVFSVAFSPDGKTLASASWDYTIKLWNVNTGQQISSLTGHQNAVISVAFSPDGKTLASASADHTIKLWNVNMGQQISNLTDQNGAYSVAFSPNGKTLASAGNKTIKLWNVNTGQQISSLSGHQNIVNSVVFSPDGKTLASASSDKTVKLWNVNTGQQISSLSGHQSDVMSVAFSPDGKTLASASADNTIKLWNVNTGQQISSLSGHQNFVTSVAFSPDGKTLASASSDKTVKLWNVNTGQQTSSLSGHQNFVNSVVFSPDGKTLASASWDKTIKLWNVNTGQQISSLSGHQNFVNSVAFSPDGKMIASASADNTIKLWNVNTSQQISSLTHQNFVNSVLFSPNGKTLAYASSDKTIKLLNLNLDDLLARGCDYLKEYLATREKERKELCPSQ
ncbi:AAA-like domain-containing protein [Dulcicalothrix desertica]|uniref:WD40 domain-containing protein n=1 Tax=Dulcicalothrix desertica TaxID=32056 RepID=UPI00119B6175|nr:AAA-like domain-containing protein [Dulcicalothrix desertica]TWH43478.1 WD40 repeat protein [Dulcicalothrix desertica PCC 7102]